MFTLDASGVTWASEPVWVFKASNPNPNPIPNPNDHEAPRLLRARCATYTAELALSQPQVAMWLARASPVAQAGGGGRCVKRGPPRVGVQR